MPQRYSNGNINWEISLQFQQTLNTLIETLIKPETLKRDLFFALLVILINENDFVLKGNSENNVIDYILSKRTKRQDNYEVTVTLDTYEYTPAKIIASPFADCMLINAIVPDINADVYSICLMINEYIVTSPLGIPLRFCNLGELFLNFIDNIIVPVKSSIISYHSQPSCSLKGLPNDTLYRILIYLPIIDIINLASTCTKFSKILKEENLWSKLYRRDFSGTIKNGIYSWKNMYKYMYLKRQRMKYETSHGIILEDGEITEWDDYMTPVRDSQWSVIL